MENVNLSARGEFADVYVLLGFDLPQVCAQLRQLQAICA